MIYILTGQVRTGKTSSLLKWCRNRSDVDGLLCPDDEKGKRYFLKVKSKNTLQLEIENEPLNNDAIISVGPFHFLKKAFDEANAYLTALNDRSDFSYLIIDELGKLELKEQGLHNAAKSLIPHYIKNKNLHLILVVRESLLDGIIAHYNISNYNILKKEDLASLSI